MNRQRKQSRDSRKIGARENLKAELKDLGSNQEIVERDTAFSDLEALDKAVKQSRDSRKCLAGQHRHQCEVYEAIKR